MSFVWRPAMTIEQMKKKKLELGLTAEMQR